MPIKQVKEIKNKVKKTLNPKKTVKNKPVVNKQEVLEEKDLPIIPIKDLEGKFLHVKVGNNDPRWQEADFSDNEIKKVEKNFLDLMEKNKINCIVFVTHHAVEINLVESVQKG
jgi:hypothetical protein